MTGLEAITPVWEDYELIDSGGFEKLERFGRFVTLRPEPQAVWRKSLPEQQWEQLATAIFRRDASSDERGRWLLQPGMPEQWYVAYCYKDMRLKMRLGLTSFKHVGLFPEQAANWNFIYDSVAAIRAGLQTDLADDTCAAAPAISVTSEKPRVLNLFAYTGGASLAACAAGADVTHVDSVRQVISWGRENMEASGLESIRWVVEDALKFVRREVRRGKTYHGIILDPPAYGRGPDGEKWVLEENIGELLELCSQLLVRGEGEAVDTSRNIVSGERPVADTSRGIVSGKGSAVNISHNVLSGNRQVAGTSFNALPGDVTAERTSCNALSYSDCKQVNLSPRTTPVQSFMVVNLYSMGLSALLAKSAVNQLFPQPTQEEFGELFFYDRAEKMLPLGVFYRCAYK